MPSDRSLLNGYELRGAVLASGMLRLVMLISLYDLGKINLSTEGLLNGFNVGSQRIGGNLHAVGHPARNILKQRHSRWRKSRLPTFE